MPIMRGPSVTTKTFKVPCSGEGVFVSVNLIVHNGAGSVAYWNGTSMKLLIYSSDCKISSITVQDGMATVIVSNTIGSDASSARVCFIPGNPLASN